MLRHTGRYTAARQPTLAEGWGVEWLTPSSRLYGANGLRTGSDGRIYVAQVSGSQISALDLQSGEIETISPQGSDIVAPDDVAFDSAGNLFVTEVMDGRVSMLDTRGHSRVLRDDLPNANGITVYQDRLFVNECRVGGRLLELDLNGGEPRVLAENLVMPNAMEVGPDGMLYYPLMGTHEIWRVHPDGGTPEKVTDGLGVPDAVKFDKAGFIVSTQVGTGDVIRVDPRTGAREVLASVGPGLDNLTFVDGRLFVSHFTGAITEIVAGGQTRETLPGALNWPLDLEVGPAGELYVADGTYFYRMTEGGKLQTLGMLMSPGFPGFVRGFVVSAPGEFVVTTANGQLARYRPEVPETEILSDGHDQLYGVATTGSGGYVVAETGAGRVLGVKGGQVEVLATGLRAPKGVACTADGDCLVSESAGGRVARIVRGKVDTVLDGLQCPQGILVKGDSLFVVDAGAKAVLSVSLKTGDHKVIARDLPIGPPEGVEPKPLRGMEPFSGPQGPFAGIAAGPDGTLYVAADGEGSVLALRYQS